MKTPMLNRRLTLEGFQDAPDEAGGITRIWGALGELWAEITPISGRETLDGTVGVSVNSLRVVVRAAPHGASSRPRNDQRFREGNRLYRILAVTEHDPRGHYLRCRVEEEVVA